MTSPTNPTPAPKAEKSGVGTVVKIMVPVIIIALGALILVTRPPGKSSQPGGGTQGTNSTDNDGVASPETAEGLLTTARAAINQGRPGEAVVVLEAGIEKHGEDQMLLATYGEALMSQALEMPNGTETERESVRAKKAEALEAYEKANFVGTENASYRDLAASLAYELGDYEKAEKYWGRAQTLASDNPGYPLRRAAALRALGRHDQAAPHLLAAVQLDPTIHEAWGGLAGISLDARRLTVAEQHIRKARELAPENLVYVKTDAKIQRGLGRYEKAATLLLSVEESRRYADAEIIQDLSYCYGMMQAPERAVVMYQEASARRPADPAIHFELARWAQRAGDLELALAASEKALSLGEPRAIALVEDLRAELGV